MTVPFASTTEPQHGRASSVAQRGCHPRWSKCCADRASHDRRCRAGTACRHPPRPAARVQNGAGFDDDRGRIGIGGTDGIHSLERRDDPAILRRRSTAQPGSACARPGRAHCTHAGSRRLGCRSWCTRAAGRASSSRSCQSPNSAIDGSPTTIAPPDKLAQGSNQVAHRSAPWTARARQRTRESLIDPRWMPAPVVDQRHKRWTLRYPAARRGGEMKFRVGIAFVLLTMHFPYRARDGGGSLSRHTAPLEKYSSPVYRPVPVSGR